VSENPNTPKPPDEKAAATMAMCRVAEATINHSFMRRMFESMVFIETDMVPSPMAVDEFWRIYYNPKLLAKYNDHQLPTMLYHECQHPFRKHPQRGKVFREEGLGHLCNAAANYEINCRLVEEKENGARGRNGKPSVDYPDDIQLPSEHNLPINLLYEQYMDLLKEIIPPPPPGGGGGSGEGGGGGGGGDQDQDDDQNNSQGGGSGVGDKPGDWELPAPGTPTPDGGKTPGVSKGRQHMIMKAVAEKILEEHSKSRGSVPLDLVMAAQEIIDPHIPWDRVLGHFLRTSANMVPGMDEESYSRTHRRQDWDSEIIRPGYVTPLPTIAIVADTSGSMTSGQELSLVLGTTNSLCKHAGCEVLFIPTDAEAHGAQRIFNARQTKLIGGGGTDMGVGIAYACGLKPRPNAIIVATDGLTPWPAEPPPIPTIIVMIGNDYNGHSSYQPPVWAKVVHVHPPKQ